MPTEIERLYREHRAGLVRLVERELHDRHDAEDAVQTAFLDAHRALERGTIPRNPRAWLATIALNAARRLRRRRLNAAPLGDHAVEEEVGTPEIRAALTSLPREQRAAVLYRDVLGLSYGETAEQMDKSVNAVTMLLHRGRRRLRQTLGVIAAGVGLWRGMKRAWMPQVAVAKGAVAVVAAAGLATGGIVAAGRAAQAIAPETQPTLVPAMRSGIPTTGLAGTSGGAIASDPARRLETADSSSLVVAAASTAATRASSGDPTPASVRLPAADAVTTSHSTSMLQVPTVSLPTLSTPTLPATVAATVTVSSPITTATVTASVGTTVTVTTPITTVTLPVP